MTMVAIHFVLQVLCYACVIAPSTAHTIFILYLCGVLFHEGESTCSHVQYVLQHNVLEIVTKILCLIQFCHTFYVCIYSM